MEELSEGETVGESGCDVILTFTLVPKRGDRRKSLELESEGSELGRS